MAWIESHQKLERHPKTLHLASLTGDHIDTVLGRLHRFWWWCLDFAEDGDLRKYDLKQISSLLGFDANHLVTTHWIDEHPYLRVHDWWDYIGYFLMRKYKNSPEKWHKIRSFYVEKRKTPRKASPSTTPNTPPKGASIPTTITNLTIPNQTKPNLTNLVAKKATPQGSFVFHFKTLYEEMTKQPFNATGIHYKLSADLIKKHGLEAVILKVKTLGVLCRDRSTWFTSGGWADFSIEKLSNRWNEIIPEVVPISKEEKEKQRQQAVRDEVKESYERTKRALES